MPHAANSFVPISGSRNLTVLEGSGNARSFFLSSRALMTLTVPRIVWAGAIVGLAFVLAGCGGSRPRFGNPGSSSPPPASSGPRFSSHEVEEERKENDRIVPPEEIEKVVSGERDFRSEKNPALTPLEASKVMREISRYMGTPYAYGGTSSDGIDCSGYTMQVYKASLGKMLPRSSAQQAQTGTPVGFSELKFGDLLFFDTTGDPNSHVGIYLGDDLFAHASVSLGVTISSLESSYYKKRYAGARRIVGP